MLYKIIIADDEEIVGNGLKDLIPWQELGFSVIKVFSDGDQVIDYIRSNDVDVILTDIKMNRV
ncbi:MAG: response regulator, partial [Candidatus Merdivicinus sp.]